MATTGLPKSLWWPSRGCQKFVAAAEHSWQPPPDVHGRHHRVAKSSFWPPRGDQKFLATTMRTLAIPSSHCEAVRKFVVATVGLPKVCGGRQTFMAPTAGCSRWPPQGGQKFLAATTRLSKSFAVATTNFWEPPNIHGGHHKAAECSWRPLQGC